MAYRSELESLQARVRALEEQLARAEGRSQFTAGDVRLGVARRIVIERELEGELDESLLERILAVLEEGFGESGWVERAGSTTTWKRTAYQKPAEVRLRTTEGRVQVRLTLPLEAEHRILVGTAGFSALAGAASLAAWTTGFPDVLTPSTLAPALVTGIGALAFSMWTRRKRIVQLRQVAARVLGMLEEELEPGALRVRVEADLADEGEESDEGDDDELEARERAR